MRWLVGAAILAVVVWRLGTGPILDGLRAVDGRSLALAAGIGFVTTVCASWRWNVVARGLGLALPLRTATAAYYRSQLLNTALPGGVLGEVDRAVRHGTEAGSPGRAARAVAWERSAGQVVQLALGLVVLVLIPSWVPVWVLVVVTAVAIGALGGGLLTAGRPPRGASGGARALRAAASDIRDGLTARRAWPVIALASVVVRSGHLATLVLAARTAGVTTPTVELLPLAMLVLLASAVPTNIGGWGPREGMAAWAFGAAASVPHRASRRPLCTPSSHSLPSHRLFRCSLPPGSAAAAPQSIRSGTIAGQSARTRCRLPGRRAATVAEAPDAADTFLRVRTALGC